MAARSEYARHYCHKLREVNNFFYKYNVRIYEQEAIDIKGVEKNPGNADSLDARLDFLLEKRDLKMAFEFVDLFYRNISLDEHARECLDRTKKLRDSFVQEKQKLQHIRNFGALILELNKDYENMKIRSKKDLKALEELNEKIKSQISLYKECKYVHAIETLAGLSIKCTMRIYNYEQEKGRSRQKIMEFLERYVLI